MSIWYKTGTVSVTNGSNAVTGVGTLFTLNASIGDMFIGPDSKQYEITAVPSDTSLAIATPLGVAAYQGATLSAQPYAIIRNFTASVNATLASKLTNLLNTWQTREDEFRVWHGGTANGGAAFDGNYPLTDAVGVAQAIASPAKLQLLAGGQVKQAVKAASTANLALTGNQTVDAIALVTNDRCLVKNQTTGSQNGIYLVAVGAWIRAADFDISADVYPQCLIPVEQGTVNLDTIWMLTTNSPITLGTTALVFACVYPDARILAGTPGYEAGNALKLGGVLPAGYLPIYGTWAPTGTYVAAGVIGKYVKIGNLVMCWGAVYAQGGPAPINIGGLPFTSAALDGNNFHGGNSIFQSSQTGGMQYGVVVNHSASTFKFVNGSADVALVDTSVVRFQLAYTTA